MKHLFINFKRFDIPAQFGGLNCLYDIKNWGSSMKTDIAAVADKYKDDIEVVIFVPEAHIINAVSAAPDSAVSVGCQSVYRADVEVGKNFGAFTGERTAIAAAALGCTHTLVGHSEERRDKLSLIGDDKDKLESIINAEIKAAHAAGLCVLLCVGESEESPDRLDVIKAQLEKDLDGVDLDRVVVAYEPIWAIGFGKKVPDANYINETLKFIKENFPVDAVYGGGLKKENVCEIGAAPFVDGGLVGLTRFAGEPGFYPEEFGEIIDLYAKTLGII